MPIASPGPLTRRRRPPRAARSAARLTLLAALAASLGAAGAGSAQEPAADHHIHGLAVPPGDPESLLVATHTGLVRLRGSAPPEWIGTPMDLMGFTAHPREPGLVFASGHPDLETYRKQKVGMLGVLVSRDGGRTWRSVALAGRADFHALAYTPRDGGQLYGWTVGDPPGLVRVTVATWATESLAAPGLADVLSLSASPDGDGPLWAGTKGGLLVSRDAGRTWLRAPGLVGERPVPAVKHHVGDPRVAFASVVEAVPALLRTRDGGATWERTAFAADPADPIVALAVGPGEVVVMATAKSDVARSDDGGRTWRPMVERGRPVGGRR